MSSDSKPTFGLPSEPTKGPTVEPTSEPTKAPTSGPTFGLPSEPTSEFNLFNYLLYAYEDAEENAKDAGKVKQAIRDLIEKYGIEKESGEDYLSIALCLGDREFITEILEKGHKVTNIDSNGNTVLHKIDDFKDVNSRSELIEQLIKKGAKVDAKNNEGQTALHLCANHPDILEALLDNGAEAVIDAIDLNGRTPLHYCNSVESAKILLSRNAKFDIPDSNGIVPAGLTLSIETAATIIDKYPDNYTSTNKTPLFHSLIKSFGTSVELIDKIISRKIDLQSVDEDHKTALHVLIPGLSEASSGEFARNWKLLESLIDNGVDINAGNKNGETILHLLAYSHEKFTKDNLQTLVNKGANLFAKSHAGVTPLNILAIRQPSWLRDITDLESEKKIFNNESEIEEFAKFSRAKCFTGLSYSRSNFPTSTSTTHKLIDSAISRADLTSSDDAAYFLEALKIVTSVTSSDNKMHKIPNSNHSLNIFRAAIPEHASYFIIECDENNEPLKLSYCDGYVYFGKIGDANKRSDGYGYGETIFSLDSAKIENLETYAGNSSLERLSSFLKSASSLGSKFLFEQIKNACGTPMETEEKILTQLQERGNCTYKSTNIAARAIMSKFHPELTFEIDGKPGGTGYEIYKKCKNDMIQLHIKDLLTIAAAENKEKFYYPDVVDTLQNQILPQAIKKKDDSLIERIETILHKQPIDVDKLSEIVASLGEALVGSNSSDDKTPNSEQQGVTEERSKEKSFVKEVMNNRTESPDISQNR